MLGNDVHDITIIGGGQAGLSAARTRVKTLLLERMGFGGQLLTCQDMATSVPGVFAAGGIRMKQPRRIVTAVGDGATAAFHAGRYIEEHF